jgi:hypothetical protein
VKSPVKKKIRRSRRSHQPGDDDDSHGSIDKYSEEQDGDDMNQKFASALSILDEGPAGTAAVAPDHEKEDHTDSALSINSAGNEALEGYIAHMELTNAELRQRIEAVQQQAHTTIESQKAKISELSAALTDLRAKFPSWYFVASSPAGAESIGSPGANDDHNNASYKRKKRVERENKEVSAALSSVIRSFLATSDLTANKRKFSRRRLAGIIIDSVLSFEWLRLEVAARPRIKEKLSRAASAGIEQSSLAELLTKLLNRRFKRCTNKRKATVLINALWDDLFLMGEAQVCMVERVRKYVRDSLFTPAKILKQMDLAGFNLSLSGIEVLRSIDCQNKYSRGFLPSKSSILRAARKLEANADNLCPFKMIGRAHRNNEEDDTGDGNNFGEGFQFDACTTTKTIFDSFGLTEEAKNRPVELALTSNGAQLTHTLSHLCTGIKLNDMAMCDPITKQPLVFQGPDSLVQSRNYCFPYRLTVEKDTKESFGGLRPVYYDFTSGNISRRLGFCPLKMSHPGDMKHHWGAIGRGGAAKVKSQFCFVCPCTSETLHVPQDPSNCDICTSREGPAVLKCYHYKFLSCPEVQEQLQAELAVITTMLVDEEDDGFDTGAEQQGERRRMYVRREGQLAVEGDLFDIDFDPTTPTEMASFSRQVTDELARRSLNVTGPLASRQQRVRQQLVRECRVRELRDMLAQSEPADRAMYLVLQGVVCILHLENRVGLKSIESILRSGMSNAMQGKLAWTTSSGVKKRQEEYINRITNIVQTRILGTFIAPSQWRFPLTEDGQMGTLSMDNNRTRSTINQIEALIDVSFPDDNPNKFKLLNCFPRYRAALVILRKKTDYTDEEIASFQEHIDAWFNDWVDVYGKEGCTNYVHMLSSSHVMRYMQEWRCLHRYSQQGWEALNALLKAYFFRRTNRGGLAKNSARKSKQAIGHCAMAPASNHVVQWTRRRYFQY